MLARFRYLQILGAALLLIPAAEARAGLHCSPGGNRMGTPDVPVTLTASYTGSLPPGSTLNNYKVWVNGVAHTGTSYTLTPDIGLNPYEYLYHATATKTVFGVSTNIDSTAGDGDNRMGDLIAISGGVQTVQYDGDHPAYSAAFGANVPRPQYQIGVYNYGACYTMGAAVTVKFHTQGSGTNNGVTLKYSCGANLCYWDGTSEGIAGWPYSTPDTSYTAGSDSTFTLPSLPSFVFKHYLSLNFILFAVFSVDGGLGSVGYQSTLAPMYAVYATPTAPMTIPWLEVLDNSCSWAAQHSTSGNVARDETLGLFFSNRFYYPGDTASYWTDSMNPSSFQLTRFVLTTSPQRGNCLDVSDYLTICANSQGIGFHVQEFAGNPLRSGVFTSNPLCTIGNDPTNPASYHPIAWTWHQIAFSGTGTVYDVCAAHAVDLSGNGYQNPPFNWPWTGEWQTIGGGGAHYGVVDTPAPNTPNATYSGLPIVGAYTPSVE